MKKMILLLAMLLMTATSFNQSSKRMTNAAQPAIRNNREKTVGHSTLTQQNKSDSRTRSTADKSSSTSRQSSQNNSNATSPRDVKNAQQGSGSSERERRQVNTDNNPDLVTPSRDRHIEESNKDRDWVRTSNYDVRRPSVSVNRTYVTRNANRDFNSPRIYKENHVIVHHYHNPPPNKAYRARHYVYRAPVELNIIWTPLLHSHYINMYPMVEYWDYPMGYRIEAISAYDAEYYKGEVVTVYGIVSEVFYSRITDEYFLYFGPYYPYQDFTVVMPGWIARRYSRSPSHYFDNQYLATTGLITTFEGNPEIVVREPFQINLY